MGESEFRNRPRPSDWVLPDDVARRLQLDPTTLAVLSESEQDGVPVPFIFSFVAELAERAEGLAETADVTEPLATIGERLDEEQARFPDSPAWDKLRGRVVEHLLELGREEAAFDFSWNIRNPHILAARLLTVDEVSGGAFSERIFETIEFATGQERKAALLRAFRDRLIVRDPLYDSLDLLNALIERMGAETDAVRGWVESQREQYPDWDWDALHASLLDEPYWTGVPMPVRQHFMWHNNYIQEAILRGRLPEEVSEQGAWLQGITQFVDRWEDAYPAAKVFGYFRSVTSLGLVADHPELAVMLATTIRDPEMGAGIVGEFVDMGFEPAAIEVATQLTDPRLLVDALTAVDWRDEAAPLHRLSEIMESDYYPTEKRIGVLEVVIERMRDSDSEEHIAPFQAQLDELRRQQ